MALANLCKLAPAYYCGRATGPRGPSDSPLQYYLGAPALQHTFQTFPRSPGGICTRVLTEDCRIGNWKQREGLILGEWKAIVQWTRHLARCLCSLQTRTFTQQHFVFVKGTHIKAYSKPAAVGGDVPKESSELWDSLWKEEI